MSEKAKRTPWHWAKDPLTRVERSGQNRKKDQPLDRQPRADGAPPPSAGHRLQSQVFPGTCQ